MTGDITDKTMVLVSRLGDFWISLAQAQKIMDMKENEPEAIINLESCFIHCRSIDGVLSADKYGELNARRRGAWQCSAHYWHERYEGCEHTGKIREAFRKYDEQAVP